MKLLLFAILMNLSMFAHAADSAPDSVPTSEQGFISLSNVQYITPLSAPAASDDGRISMRHAVVVNVEGTSEAVGVAPDCHCSTGTAGAAGSLNLLSVFNPFLQIARYASRPVERKLTCGTFRGEASWYSAREGHAVAGPGYRFHSDRDQAANKTLPFGTVVTLHCPSGKAIPVTIVDDGPHVRGRIIDLTRGTAEKCGILSAGHGPITMDVPCPSAAAPRS